MKKTLLITLFALLGVTQAVADIEFYPALVREGVKWVNEKVIINHGDTTSYYYTYEFSGYDTVTIAPGEPNQACYYYTGKNLDTKRDSLIAGMRNGYKEATCFRNYAYAYAIANDRLLFQTQIYMDGGTRILYKFGEYRDPYDGSRDNWIRVYHLACQYDWSEYYSSSERVLTEDNFIMVDPVEVDGISCKRSAYINEQSDTMCCVIESIGFDSKCMGDLLTPFMTPPDPDADYQEYCGLSHVVKDGQIIYKGMRWREGAFEGIDEVVADKSPRPLDPNYYNLMGQPVGKDVPTAPGIYIHQGKKIIVR